jgi:hypothetical protein
VSNVVIEKLRRVFSRVVRLIHDNRHKAAKSKGCSQGYTVKKITKITNSRGTGVVTTFGY